MSDHDIPPRFDFRHGESQAANSGGVGFKFSDPDERWVMWPTGARYETRYALRRR